MKFVKIISLFLSFVFILTMLVSCKEKETEPVVYTRESFSEEQLELSDYDVEKYTMPFWEGNIVYNECVFPMYNADGIIEPFTLMYKASEIISVKNYMMDTEYTEGEDYCLEDGKLVIIPEGNIDISGYSYLHREGVPEVSYDDLILNLEKNGTEYINPSGKLSKKTIVVTYIHNDTCGFEVSDVNEKAFKKTIKRMKKGKETNVVVTGDSISVGYNSSKFINLDPHADPYVDMACKALQDRYNNPNINFINSAVGGSTAEFTQEELDKAVIQYNPSLVIIAYGANDAMFKRSTEEYISDISGRIDYIRSKLPKCEILIITPTVANPRVYDVNLFKEYADALHEVKDNWKRVEVCDPQKIQITLMEEYDKEYVCFAADNYIHPNDYGMRIIAQCVIDALTE